MTRVVALLAHPEGFCRLPLAFVNNLPAYEYLP